jgi:hypothetical protein
VSPTHSATATKTVKGKAKKAAKHRKMVTATLMAATVPASDASLRPSS